LTYIMLLTVCDIADSLDLPPFKLFWWAPKDYLFLPELRFCHSRSSKVTDFGTNRKHVCDFLLVHHSNLGPILHRFRYCRFFCAPDPTLFHPNFGGVPVEPDRPCWGQCEQVPWAIRPWNYFRSMPTYVITDRQVDRRHTVA